MTRRAFSVVLIAFAAILLLVAVSYCPSFELWNDPALMREWVATLATGAPMAIVLLQATRPLLAPIPGQAVSVAAGYLLLMSCWLGANAKTLGRQGWMLLVVASGLLALASALWGERLTRWCMRLVR